MAVIGNTALTLADWSKRVDPDGAVPDIVEILNQSNEVLQDMLFVEGNLPTGHRTTVRSGLPSVAWRMLNYGIQPGKSTTVQVDDSCGMLEGLAVVDEALLNLNGNSAAFRMSEDAAFLEAMNQEMASTLIYGNTATDPKKFLGLAPRYNDLTNAANKVNIIDAAGTGSDNTSIWLVGWGDKTCHGIFPKGSKAGIKNTDMGIELVSDGAGGQYRAARTHYKWDTGFVLRDWRYVVRIANIDVSNLVGESSANDVIKSMIRAMHRIPNLGACRPVFYMNRTVRQMLDIQALNKSNSAVAVRPAAEQFKSDFLGVPIRTVDAILNTEARVV